MLGNPFVPRTAPDAGAAAEAYAELLRGSRSAHAIAKGHRERVTVHEPTARVSVLSRMTALSRLAARVRRGERLRLRCGHGVCHSQVIMEWIMARSVPPRDT